MKGLGFQVWKYDYVGASLIRLWTLNVLKCLRFSVSDSSKGFEPVLIRSTEEPATMVSGLCIHTCTFICYVTVALNPKP